MDNDNIVDITDIFRISHSPLIVSLQDSDLSRLDAIKRWWQQRSIPVTRDNLRKGLDNLGYAVDGPLSPPLFLLRYNYGLSLSDQYWLKPVGSSLEWKDINYFTNGFSDDVGTALFENQKVIAPDLNSPCNSLNGWLKKKWITIDNESYLIKGSSVYGQEACNEVIASEVCRLLGIPHISYSLFLSTHNNTYSICRNGIDENTELITASEIKYALSQSANSNYEHYCLCCESLNIPDYKTSLEDMIVVDYIMCNQDRHYGNFGAVRNVETLKYEGFFPVFDTGSSLRYDTPKDEIDVSLDVSSLPFESFHSEQIKLVNGKERYDLTKLRSIPEFASEVFSQSSGFKQSRSEIITEVLRTRISMLDKALCKGYTQGASLNSSVIRNSHGRGR